MTHKQNQQERVRIFPDRDNKTRYTNKDNAKVYNFITYLLYCSTVNSN